MMRKTSMVWLLVFLFVARMGVAAEKPLALDVWPGKAPGDFGKVGEEHFREPWSADSKGIKWLTSVTKPTITVFRPAKEKDTGAAMLVCPGGGYWNLAWDLEGEEVAAWLNSIGVTGIILKYRVPRRPGQSVELPAPGPLQDAQRALSLVRSKAPEWGIDPARIGMVGFSAGGHLVLATATNFDKRTYEPIDDIDKVSCRPDFAVSIYPGYLVVKDTTTLSSHVRIPSAVPPVFLAHSDDDTMAKVDNSVVMYQAMKAAGVPVELHVYASGGHGFGVRPTNKACSRWTASCVEWLRDRGFLDRDRKEQKTPVTR